MACLTLPVSIVSAFLVLTLIVGIYFSRIKTTFRVYAVGHKNLATATLVATLLATAYGGGGLIRNVECVHSLGLTWIVATILPTCFGMWMIGKLALRMGPFMEHLSIAETIGHVYGNYARIVAALIGICKCIIIITIQINVMSYTTKIVLGSINPHLVAILATLLLVFYSTFGGARAVIYTDVLQFLTFSIIIPLLAWFMFVKIGKPIATIMPMLSSYTNFQFSSLFQFNKKLLGMLLLVPSIVFAFIDPPLIQRVYMCSDPIQARKVFSYAAAFKFIIASFIMLVGLFVFIGGGPGLKNVEIWPYIMNNIPPYFKGLLAISLLAMAMSTADSCLNVCAVMVSHDIIKSLYQQKIITEAYQLKIAQRITLVIGLSAMIVALQFKDLLQLLFWSFACAVPILAAPFILAIFGFRGTSRTALVGMSTGLLAILAWHKWVNASIRMDGCFLATLANGLAMMAAHYLLKQPKHAGWVKPDHSFKQIQQAYTRKRAERREAIQNAWANRATIFTKLLPTDSTFRLTGLYLIMTAILGYWFITPERICWAVVQAILGVLFTSSKTFFSKAIPACCIGLIWLIGLAAYLPINLIWHWWHAVDPIFTTSLSLAHCAVILSVLSLYLAISVVATTLLLAIYPISITLSYSVLCSLFPLFIVALLILSIIIYLKIKLSSYITQNLYLKHQESIREAQQLKASLYDATLFPSHGATHPKGYGFNLKQVVRKVEESISFLDKDTPLFKEDFQSIINKFYDWIVFFNKKEKAKSHALLHPTKISLDKLIRKVEVTLSQTVENPPKLLIEKISVLNQEPSPDMVCDINQVVYSLVKAILRMGRLGGTNSPVIGIHLHPTSLQLKQADSMRNNAPALFMNFPATALVISPVTTFYHVFPNVKAIYDEIDTIDAKSQKDAPPFIDLEQHTIASMVRAHYGYLDISGDDKQPTILLVLPNDITDILNKITVQYPIDCLTAEALVTPKEQADSMMTLMKFHDHFCKSLCEEDPIDVKTISGLLLLLRQNFGFKRHASGQLFYVRAVRIAALLTDWVFHSPKVIYASLLYELVRHTCLPLSYIKEHYNLGVYTFVSNVVKIDKREELDDPALLYVQNRLEKAIKEDHVQLSVLFIKLAERLHDLRHAAGYTHSTEVQHMAQETLAIDVQIAQTYLGPEIGYLLEKAAKEALKISKHTTQTKKDQDK
ncbi:MULTISPECIES: sodium:solute symporter family protein [Candidatus Cardinium]|uniref:sodium:solute symporter family protein n=1 Tax=Candidatus Cardinium TaxID=273135 RepID=UPI001FA99A80|nr:MULTISPECIES: sodium:solute symporter family protein [Cardinium]